MEHHILHGKTEQVTICMAIFDSYVSHCQRVTPNTPVRPPFPMVFLWFSNIKPPFRVPSHHSVELLAAHLAARILGREPGHFLTADVTAQVADFQLLAKRSEVKRPRAPMIHLSIFFRYVPFYMYIYIYIYTYICIHIYII